MRSRAARRVAPAICAFFLLGVAAPAAVPAQEVDGEQAAIAETGPEAADRDSIAGLASGADDSPLPEPGADEMGLVEGPLEPVVTEVENLVLPPIDRRMQALLNRALSRGRFRDLTRRGSLSVVLIDLSDPDRPRHAAVLPDSMRYAASLPKIGIMLTVFAEIDAGRLSYTPRLRDKIERMIRRSENAVSSELIQLVGFETIERTLRDPRYALYDPAREGGIWVGRGYGAGVGTWKRDPVHQISHGATARQVARFLMLVEREELISPWASREMKRIMGNPEIRHKFVAGLLTAYPLAKIFRKSGTFRTYHADAAIVERAGRKYIAVALLEAPERGILAELITVLDDIVVAPGAEELGSGLSPDEATLPSAAAR